MTDYDILYGLKKIKFESSSNQKASILKRYKDESDFKNILKYLCDNSYVFGISSKKISKKVSVELKQDCNSILEVFDYLNKNNTGTDFDIYVVQNFVNKFDNEEQKQMLIELFCKSLKIGVTTKTLEKIFPDMFQKFEVMAGEPYEKRFDVLDKEKPDIIVTQKFDGCRCLVRVENHKVILYARSGKTFTGLNDLEKELSQLPNGVYDGELLKFIDGTITDITKFPQKSICHKLYCPKNAEELYSDTVSIVNSKEEDKKNIGIFLFDMISIEDFEKKQSDKTTCSVRKSKLEMLLSTYDFKLINFASILYEGKFNAELIDSMLNVAIQLEQEGLMINITEAPYEFKRTNNLIKVKQVYTADVMVRGFEEGTGKNKGKLGALIIKTPQGVELKVGSGISDEDREYVWNNQAGYIGCIFEIAFTTPSTSKDNNLYNLRFPRFKRWRVNDKAEENWEMFDKLIEELEKNKNG